MATLEGRFSSVLIQIIPINLKNLFNNFFSLIFSAFFLTSLRSMGIGDPNKPKGDKIKLIKFLVQYENPTPED